VIKEGRLTVLRVLLRAWRFALAVVCAFFVMIVGYAALCPIMYRMSSEYRLRYPHGGRFFFFEFMVDTPCLRKATLSWCSVWGVREDFEIPSAFRSLGFDERTSEHRILSKPREYSDVWSELRARSHSAEASRAGSDGIYRKSEVKVEDGWEAGVPQRNP
jgi:hypothetical protein